MDPKAQAILQAITQAATKVNTGAQQMIDRQCPTCGQPVPQDAQAPQPPQDQSDSSSDSQ